MKADYAHNCTINRHDEKNRHKVTFTPEQVIAIRSWAKGTPIEMSINLLYFLGLRMGEMLGLRWQDVDWEHHVIHITRSMEPYTNTYGDTKTHAGNRYVPIPDELYDILRQHRGLPTASISDAHTHETVYRWWHMMIHDLGMDKHSEGNQRTRYEYTPHTFRHTYATLLFDANIDPVSASRILGHASYKTTADIYTNISENRASMNATIIRSVFQKGCQKVATGSETR